MLPHISIRQLQYFSAVYEERSFSRAAERENCTQPALSAQVRGLEVALSTILFERVVNGVIPTVAGKQFYAHAIGILRSLHLAEREITELGDQVSGELCIGLVPSIMRGLLPNFLTNFVETFPKVELQLVESFSGTLINWLLAQEIDFAVIVAPTRHEALDVINLGGGPAVLLSTAGAPVPHRQPIRLTDLSPVNLVLPTPRHGLRQSIDRSISAGDLRIARSIQMDSVCGMIEFVKRSDWVTILPTAAIACDINSKDLVVNPIIDPILQGQLFLIHLKRAPLSRAGSLFIDALKAEIDQAQQIWSLDQAELPIELPAQSAP